MAAEASTSPSPFYTFEVFPPKTAIGTHNLIDRIERMCTTLDPSWIHVTWGAGGSTQERSLELAGAVQGLGVDVCLHLTCTNMERSVLDGTLEVGLLALFSVPFWNGLSVAFGGR